MSLNKSYHVDIIHNIYCRNFTTLAQTKLFEEKQNIEETIFLNYKKIKMNFPLKSELPNLKTDIKICICLSIAKVIKVVWYIFHITWFSITLFKIHNNDMWDSQYSSKYSQIFPTFIINVRDIKEYFVEYCRSHVMEHYVEYCQSHGILF